jgi:hypothetical protein
MLVAIIFVMSALLLFARVGHYAIWDDEAMISLVAKGILRTGDTSVLPDDHNIVAYRNGLLVRDLHDRSTPPLAAYLTAGSFALFGENACSARLPFALFGLALVALLLWWSWVERADWLTTVLFAMAILGNVSLFLYCRNCRYYAPTIFFSVAIAFLYLRCKGATRGLLAISLLSILLFAANYMAYVLLYLCIIADYFIWRRKERPLGWKDWLVLLGPQLIANAGIASVWNPLKTQFGGYVARNDLADRFTLFFWNLRDLNACEFCVGILVLAAPFVGLIYKKPWLVRGSLALGIYVAAATAVSPQLVHDTSVADVRYLVPLIPLCLALEVLTLVCLFGKKPRLALGIAFIAFTTNLLHGGLFFSAAMLPEQTRPFKYSTLASYLSELISPPDDPYAVTAKWIREHVRERESVWVAPDYMAYPLMFHAPQATYAWQLAVNNHDPQFAALPPIHFQGRVPPDYIIAFGPVVRQIAQMLQNWNPVRYERVATLDCFWKDMYRPELFWRTFMPITHYNKQLEAIYIFKRIAPVETPSPSASALSPRGP